MKFSELSFVVLLTLIPCLHCVLPGGQSELPLDHPDVVRLTQVALLKINEGNVGASSSSDGVEVIKATRQIVSGTLTRLTLRITQGSSTRVCNVEIWEQPWLDRTEVTVKDCDEDSEKKKRSIVSGAVNEEERNDAMLGLFSSFLKKHNKVYEDEKEYQKRFRIFRANIKKIELLRKTEQGTAQYGLTHFSDMTATEFKNYLGLKVPEHVEELPPAEIPDIELPDNFDWRHYNVVTPVKDQKSCGSCWAFSVTGNVEGQWALKKGELLSLSEQELIDCDTSDNGCGGGYMTNAFLQIMKMGGLETESEYPYDAKDEKCQFNRSEAVAQISGAVNITSDEVKMAKWLVKNGPMSVALNANAMQFYFGGVSHPLKFLCDPKNLDHGVLIVGFGVHQSRILNRTMPFWIIKNSWGKRWGERGYYRLYRGDGSCGIDQMVSSSIVN